MTPDEVDAKRVVQVDVDQTTVTIASYDDGTYDGRPIKPGRYFEVLTQHDGIMRSLGLVHMIGPTEFFAFEKMHVSGGLGRPTQTLNAAIRILARDPA